MTPKIVTSFIGGEWVEPNESSHKIKIIHPADEQHISTLYEADTNEVSNAAETAKKTFDSGVWSNASVDDRKSVLLAIKDLIIENKEEIAEQEVMNTGAPITQAYGRQIPRSAMNFEFFAEFISQASSPVFDQNPDYITYVRREPIGVAGLIAPWNAPMALATMKIAGAIAFGNSCVLKPSELAPATSRVLKELIDSVFPQNMATVIEGDAGIAKYLLDKKWDYIFFTGSTRIGKIIAEKAAKNLTPITLELGGKSPCIVDSGVDIDKVAKRIVSGKFVNCGQTCISRLYCCQSTC